MRAHQGSSRHKFVLAHRERGRRAWLRVGKQPEWVLHPHGICVAVNNVDAPLKYLRFFRFNRISAYILMKKQVRVHRRGN